MQPGKTPEQLSKGLIEYLRTELDNPAAGYANPLTQMQGGNETYTYRFKLNGVGQELAKPLVLRLYPQIYGTTSAVRESTIQNALAGEGYPVPRVYFTCTDLSLLDGAFFIMELLAGELMMTAPFDTVPSMLGKAHAALHNIDPKPLIESLGRQGFGAQQYSSDRGLERLAAKASRHPWSRRAADWLIENRPPKPATPSICHGDFHPLNILVKEGQVTGVLDWPGFLVNDPVLDVANTIVLITIPGQHLYALAESDTIIDAYLNSYRRKKPLTLTYLDYYIVRRCVFALVEGAEGQEVWQQPPIVDDFIETIDRISGIRIIPPDQTQQVL